MVYDNILKVMGHTPLIRLHRMAEPNAADIVVKFEGINVGGSVKTRTAKKWVEKSRILENMHF